MDYPLWKRAVAEVVGTFALVYVGVGSIVAAAYAGIEGGGGIVSVALAHGLAIATMVTAVGHVSGGHFNPAVTLGALVAKAIRPAHAAVYVVVQLLGAVAASLAIRASVPVELWQKVDLGIPSLAKDGVTVSFGQGVLIEAVLTFFLVWVVMAVAVDPGGAFAKVAGLPIGLVVAMDIMAGGPLTGAAMNPARAFGPALAGGYWTDHLVYWIGPALGALAASALYAYGILPRPETSEARLQKDAHQGGRSRGEKRSEARKR